MTLILGKLTEKFVKQIEEYKSKVESRGKFYL